MTVPSIGVSARLVGTVRSSTRDLKPAMHAVAISRSEKSFGRPASLRNRQLGVHLSRSSVQCLAANAAVSRRWSCFASHADCRRFIHVVERASFSSVNALISATVCPTFAGLMT